MEISYLGHSCVKLRGKAGTVVCDPYAASVGFAMPAISADIVTVSHEHDDHAASGPIKPTARRDRPFLITEVGEYEVGGISVFGFPSYHDDQKGAERGRNVMFKVVVDGVTICHLGDLGHTLTEQAVEDLGIVDVLLCPVGGVFTISPQEATQVIQDIDPSIVIPIHYKTPQHAAMYEKLATLEVFLKEFGAQAQTQPKLIVESGKLPEELQLTVLERSHGKISRLQTFRL
jgi:L-ascorbate metabolism protein UlaG (beta-lactamase superfamily)